jgi:2-aminomuconate deaminase
MVCNSENAPVPVADYSHAVKVPLDETRSLLYLCGMGPRDKETNKVPAVKYSDTGDVLDYDIKLQTQNVFNNINQVILDAGGTGLRDIIDVQVFLVDIEKDFKNFNAVWKENMSFNDGWRPTRTTVQVAALPLKEIFVELKCIALLKED